MSDLLTKLKYMNVQIIKILKVEQTKTANGKNVFKIKDERGLTYSLYPTKADGTESKAYEYFKTLPLNGIDATVEVSVNEEPGEYQGKEITYRTIVGMRFTNQNAGFAKEALEKSLNSVPAKQAPKADTDWDKISWGKCKHAYLVETYKIVLANGALDKCKIDEIEKTCEKWADMSMRKLEPEPTLYGVPTSMINLDNAPLPEEDYTETDRGRQYHDTPKNQILVEEIPFD